MTFSRIVLLASLCGAVRAANDWNVPCLSGECSYDLPETSGSTASGTVKIWGDGGGISDITVAAGWEIMDCSPDALEQDIRLVCNTNDERSAGCANLFENAGAEGKVVRLPESCGANAFARVARAWIPEDQSMPESIARRVVRRDGSAPEVQALTIDTNFAAVDPSRGTINIAIQAGTVPVATTEIIVAPVKRSHPRDLKRQAPDFVNDAIDGVSDLNEFDVDDSLVIDPIDVNQSGNILDVAIDCPPLKVALKADVDAIAQADANLGFVAKGTVVPPNFDQFSVIMGYNMNIDGTLTLKTTATGTLVSEDIPLFEVGLPGFNFPGIFSVGPSFKIISRVVTALDVIVDMKVGFKYSVTDAKFVYPPNDEAPTGNYNPNDTPLQLSIAPNVAAVGRLEAHLIPSINLGISALGDTAAATIFLNADASVGLELSLKATLPEIDVAGGDESVIARELPPAPRAAPGTAVGWKPVIRQEVPVEAAAVEDTAQVPETADVAVVDDTAAEGGNVDFLGCAAVVAGFQVNVGATASFFSLFDSTVNLPLFKQKFDLFRQCFGEQPPAVPVVLPPLTVSATGLLCSSVTFGTPNPLTDATVPGTDLLSKILPFE